MLWNGENLDFKRFSGIEKVHRNSIKITVDYGGSEGSRTPVRKPLDMTFSVGILSFDSPPPLRRQTGSDLGQPFSA